MRRQRGRDWRCCGQRWRRWNEWRQRRYERSHAGRAKKPRAGADGVLAIAGACVEHIFNTRTEQVIESPQRRCTCNLSKVCKALAVADSCVAHVLTPSRKTSSMPHDTPARSAAPEFVEYRTQLTLASSMPSTPRAVHDVDDPRRCRTPSLLQVGNTLTAADTRALQVFDARSYNVANFPRCRRT
jgi:hypothetical protein